MKAVLDIGKTNVKLQLVDESGQATRSFSRKNTPLASGPYPHADVSGIWHWLIETLRVYTTESSLGASPLNDITALIVTTHGATAALISTAINTEDGLVLPIVDYEFTGVNDCDESYRAIRPDFAETLSPDLPAGLNLGRQIFWLQEKFSNEFTAATQILMYPQYWAWRLTGQLAGEVTSLGCHTDLWSPLTDNYSTLVQYCGWQTLLPPLKSAWQELGCIASTVVEQTGLPAECKVYVGLHDSNASYLRYLLNSQSVDKSFTIISTGTWTILMQARGDLSALSQSRDTLANCDIYGHPVACARFMGGREYDEICQRLGGDINSLISAGDVQSALDNFWMVTPDFSAGNGPFGGLQPVISCPLPAASAGAIATLYCALMIDQRLDDLQASGPIYIEGAFLKNSLLCALVAQLRIDQAVYLSADDTGTVQGAFLLTSLASQANSTSSTGSGIANSYHLQLESCAATDFKGLADYRARWYELIAQAVTTANTRNPNQSNVALLD